MRYSRDLSEKRLRCSVHPLLESVHSLRPPSGLWTRAKNADEHRGRHLYTKPDAAQLGRQSDYLLPLQYSVLQNRTVSTPN